MFTLTLLRHAKSSWADEAIDDHDRPLNARGRRDAIVLARTLSERPHPCRVLCSTATRTRETLATLQLAGLVDDAAVTFERTLYLAAPKEIDTLIGSAQSEHLLVIGHNPGIESLASHFAGRELSMKTSSFCHFERKQHDTPWRFVQQQTPRD